MAKDAEFKEMFKKQIHLLENLEKAVQEALKRAGDKLAALERGEPIEKVFGKPTEK
jgi:hypothetical protein